MPITLGILSQFRAAPAAAGSYELIETVALTSSAASVTFSSLGTYASTYRHLQIRYVARSSRTIDNQSWIRLSVNGTAFDRWHDLRGNGSSVTSNTAAIPYIGLIPSVNQSANIFGAGVIDLLDPFQTTKNKTARALHGFAGNISSFVILNSALRIDTTSTTSITLAHDPSDLFVSGSRFSLYGIKG
jgi:hypothetical protein